MKSIFTIFTCFFLVCKLAAQIVPNAEPAYKAIPQLPPFSLHIAPDSSLFNKDMLLKKTQTMVVVFSPDCDHCVHATQELIKNIHAFKKVQIIMATALPYNYVQKFYKDLQLEKYPNIKVGTDKSYFLGTFYGVRSFPNFFLYNKKGLFKQAFSSKQTIEDIIKAL
jgi:thioredoxin-related protein